jgi:protein polybromo-1
VKNKEYFNSAPDGYDEEDVYVCEYRYSQRGRSFSKLKIWSFGSERVKLIPRKKVLEPIRVASVFRERVEKHKEELQHMEDEFDKIPPEEFPNIELDVSIPGKDDYTFYEQYSLVCGPIRAGDYVYVRVENAKKLIARVDTMWSDSNGVTYFHGPWFTSLVEVSPTSIPTGRTFFKQEIFQSSIEDTNPLLSICGRCCVLDVEDYIKSKFEYW